MNPLTLEKLKLYAQLVRLDKPIGIYLLLWPTLWALAIAGEGGPDLWVLFVFVCGVVLMRSAGCAINDYADRGTAVRGISLVADNPEHIEGRVNNQHIVILTKFVKK